MSVLPTAIAGFILIVAIATALRMKLGEKFEIKNSDILLAIVPIALWLVLTGKIQKLEFGDFKIEAAFVKASQAAVAPQVTPIDLPVEPVRAESKGGVSMIPSLIHKKTQALTFRLGYGGYYGPAIQEYFERLMPTPFFKYVVLLNRDDSFVAQGDARLVYAELASSRSGFEMFAEALNRGEEAKLLELPGIIAAKDAILQDTDKQTALERMEAFDVETLPVIDAANNYVGVVERSRLLSSMIIEVTQKLR